VDGCYEIFEKHHGVKNHTLSLAHRMVTRYQLVQAFQMNILNMVPHVRIAFEGTSPFVVCIPLVPDAEDALGLAQNEGKLVELREGIGRGGGWVRLFLNRILAGRRRLRLAGLRLLSRSERGHSVDGKYLPGDNVLRAQVFREIAEELLDRHPLCELVLNRRLRVFCILIVRRVQVSLQLASCEPRPIAANAAGRGYDFVKRDQKSSNRELATVTGSGSDPKADARQ
jgi:hypothetical protein